MNCFECALKGQEVPAVATCGHCGAAMYLEHVALAEREAVRAFSDLGPTAQTAAGTMPRFANATGRTELWHGPTISSTGASEEYDE